MKCRQVKGKEDYFRLRKFLEDYISVTGAKYEFNINDLEFALDICEDKDFLESIVDQLENFFLWFEGEEVIGGIWVFKRLQVFINPNKKHLFEEMFKSVELAVNNYIEEKKGEFFVNSFKECTWRAFDGDKCLENVLKENGYYKTNEYWVLRAFNHDEPIDEPELPDGYYFTTISKLSNITKVIEIYRRCLGMEFDEFALRNFDKFPTSREELNIVVMSPENQPVALCSGGFDEKNKMVTFEAVACLHEYRKKGISKAMMLHALKVSRSLGAKVSTILTLNPEQFPAPNRLYESVGFKKVGHRYTWKKEDN